MIYFLLAFIGIASAGLIGPMAAVPPVDAVPLVSFLKRIMVSSRNLNKILPGPESPDLKIFQNWRPMQVRSPLGDWVEQYDYEYWSKFQSLAKIFNFFASYICDWNFVFHVPFLGNFILIFNCHLRIKYALLKYVCLKWTVLTRGDPMILKILWADDPWTGSFQTLDKWFHNFGPPSIENFNLKLYSPWPAGVGGP